MKNSTVSSPVKSSKLSRMSVLCFTNTEFTNHSDTSVKPSSNSSTNSGHSTTKSKPA